VIAPKTKPSTTELSNRRAVVQESRRRVFNLGCDMEKLLNQALAFANIRDETQHRGKYTMG